MDCARANGKDVTNHTSEVCRLVGDEYSSNVETCLYAIQSGAETHLVIDESNAPTLIMPGRRYSFRVRAANSLGSGPWSTPLVYTLTSDVPDQPAAPQLGAGVPGLNPDTSIHVVWTPPESHGTLILEYELSQVGSPQPFQIDGSHTQYVMADVLPGSGFNFTLRARNSYGWSSWSPWGVLFTQSTVPSALAKPIATVDRAQQLITLNWTHALGNGYAIANYEIEGGSASYLNATLLPENAISYLFYYPEENQTYLFRVRANNSAGPGPWSPFVEVRPSSTFPSSTFPFPPVIIYAAADGPYSIFANWTHGGGVGYADPEEYEIYIGTYVAGSKTSARDVSSHRRAISRQHDELLVHLGRA